MAPYKTMAHTWSCVMQLAVLLLAILQANPAAAAVDRIIPNVVRVREGRGVSFQCYGDPADSLYWFDGAGQRIAEVGSFDLHLQTLSDGGRTFKIHTLEINPAARTHTGSYCCSTLINADADCSSGVRANLTVLIPSSSAVAPAKQRFEANTDAFVRCSIEPGLPQPLILWYSHKAGRSLDFQQTTADGMLKYTANYSGLLIRDFQPSDVSNYTCEYQEPVTASSSALRIEVLLATTPYIDGIPEAPIGTEVQLTCHHEEADRVYWVTPHSKVVQGDTLTISNSTRSDSGAYRCVVRHSNGENLTASHQLQIYVPPLPSKKTLVPFIVQGATAVLRFTTTNMPYPPLSYVWTKDGMEITEGNKYTVLDDGVLQISDFSLADEGLYLCIGSNKYSVAERSFYPKTSVPETSVTSTTKASLYMTFTISGLQSCDDYATGYDEQLLLTQKMSTVVQETCSCLVDVMLLEVTCSDSKHGTMKWQLTGPSAGAVVDYIVNKNQNGHLLASNLTVLPCQRTCNPLSQAHQEEQVSDTLKAAVAVVSMVAVIAIVVTVFVAVLGCYCHKKSQRRAFSPNETDQHQALNPSAFSPSETDQHQAPNPRAFSPNETVQHHVPNPMYPHVSVGDEEAGQAEPEELAASPQSTNVPVETGVPVVIVDTPGYSRLQHFTGNRDCLRFVHVQYIEAVSGDEVNALEQSYISENQNRESLDEAHGVDDATGSNQSGAVVDNTQEDACLGNEMSDQLLENVPLHGDRTNYRVNCRPPSLPTRSGTSFSDSDGTASCISNSPSTEMHLTVPSRVRRADVFEEEDEVFASMEVSKNEPKRRQRKAPMPLPRTRRFSKENVIENEGACIEPPPLYEDVVLAKS